MGSLSLFHWIIVLVVVLLLFGGRGRLSSMMADVGKGIRSFRKGMDGEDEDKKQIEKKD